jgi:DNA-binding NarL/FixJ family response regulator
MASLPPDAVADLWTDRPIGLIIADDAQRVRQALAQLIMNDDRLRLLGSARDGDEAVALASALQPDLAVLDVRMPGGGGPDACRRILARSPHTRVVALSGSSSPALRRRMAGAGAVAYLTKETENLLDQLVELARRPPSGSAPARQPERHGGPPAGEIEPEPAP